MYYGQIPDNLPYNLKAILVEKFEKECIKKAIWYLRFSIGDDPRKDL